MSLVRASSEASLSPLGVELLRVVVEIGEVRASDLARRLIVTKTSISRYVNEMLDAGLLVQRRDPTDGRATLLSISALGRRTLVEREARRSAVLRELCAGWSEYDVDRLTSLLQRLNDRHQQWLIEQRGL